MSQNNAITSRYFSGQGIVSIATRSTAGEPQGFVNIGDVSALSITQEVTKEEHTDHTTGNRATDAVLQTKTTVGVSMTIGNLSRENLALMSQGSSATVAAGSVTNEVVKAYLAKTVALAHPNVAAVNVTNTAGTVTYVVGSNYTVNAEAGSINILNAAAQTAAVAPIADLQDLHIDYTYAAYDTVDAFTSAAPERWIRFEGLNTADSNKPVIVDIFKFLFSPFAELPLINDSFAEFVVEGEALSDSTKLTGSKHYRVRIVA
mgnify:CR=1 FL=1